MKLFYSTLVAICFSATMFGQQLTPNVIASAGASFQSAAFSLDYTLGETFVTTLNNGTNILTQGFHQPQSGVVVEGCTAIEACNYNPDATTDDGSCLLVGYPCDDSNPASLNDELNANCECVGLLSGCTFPVACNFDPAASIDDGSCVFIGEACDDGLSSTINDVIDPNCGCSGEVVVEGCIAFSACNFNQEANTDDGTCVFPGDPCNDSNASTLDDIIGIDCQCAGTPVDEIEGCTDAAACNYNPTAVINNGTCFSPGDLCSDGDATTLNDTYNADCICEGEVVVEIEGCTSPNACNYDFVATIDDGSCFFIGDVCDDQLAETSNDVIIDDCSCEGEIILVFGCTDNFACNYNSSANAEDGSCLFTGESCDDNDDATVNDAISPDCICEGEVIVVIEGCTSPNACNYDFVATIDDGSCFFVGDVCDDQLAETSNDVIIDDCSCVGVVVDNLGCTSEVACNYDANAFADDGSCLFPGDTCDDGDETTQQDEYNAECVCEGLLAGCTVPVASNYNPDAIIDDGSCEFDNEGCTDQNALNYDPAALVDDGSCIYPLEGCTDPAACNYSPDANIENGSCTFPGCTDTAACNYDATAACSDTSCEYPATYLDCAGNCLNDINQNGVCDELDAQGCTDENALNFDPIAIFDNGSCVYEVLGCTDADACNFNEVANTNDGSCTFPGCNDPEACNYDPQAGCYDGNCDYPFNNYDCNGNCLNDSNSNGICDEYEEYGCTDETAVNYSPDATSDDGSCLYDGCTDVLACNYDETADVDDGTCTFPGCLDMNACNYDVTAGCQDISICTYPTANYLDCEGNCINDGNGNGICDEFDSEGCLDPAADNYNPNATIEDGSCIYEGCTDMTACNYDPTALDDDGTCVFPGCTEMLACNYNPSAGCDDGSCEFGGCTDTNACNYDMNAACDDGSCSFPGCVDVTACNYDSSAGCSADGTCIYADLPYDCNGNCINDADNDGICDEFDNLGCTDPNADNYNASAVVDDGSCIYLGCTDILACNYDPTAVNDDGTCTYPSINCLDCNGVCIDDSDADGTCDCLEIEGCTNPASINYNPLATEFDGSCVLGCTDVFAINYNTLANEDDGSCIYQVLGCTYPTACNYNPEATTDNNTCTFPGCNDFAACNYDPDAGCLLEGSCEYIDVNNNGQCDLYEITGCTNGDACNYNSAATFDDGSCGFDTEEIIEIEAGNEYVWNGTTYTESGIYEFMYVSTAGCDSLVILDLTITSVFELSTNSLEMWPNPANSEVQITMNGTVADMIEVFDIAGKHVATFNRKSRFDVSDWASGSYMIRVRNEGTVMERRLMVVR